MAAAGIEAVFDIELTTLCNAHCTFCPRDQTPHLGLIDEATFAQALHRAVEYRDLVRRLPSLGFEGLALIDDTIWLSFCGMGDALVHPKVVDHVREVADAGLLPVLNTNAATLDPAKADRLLDAGLARVCVNAGEVGVDYEAVYGLPFQRTHDNVVALAEKAAGRCQVTVVLVDHRGDPQHRDDMVRYWADRGITSILPFALVNRAGALDVPEQEADHQAYGVEAGALFAAAGVVPQCATPYIYPIVGYDGRYYLCSSDWRKEVPVGNVFDHAVVDLYARKGQHVRSRSPICRRCTHDPTNELARVLAERDRVVAVGGDEAAADGVVSATVASHGAVAVVVEQVERAMRPAVPVTIAAARAADDVGS